MKNIYLIPFIALFTFGCSQKTQQELPTVNNVELNQYLGKWYEIAKYENRFEIGCKNATAIYELNTDNSIKVTNECLKNGQIKKAIGTAYSTNKENTKLKVSFFWPFKGNYWIILLDKEYKYAVVSEPTRKYLWILSRTQTLPQETIDTIIKELKIQKFDTNKLIFEKL
jgi:apolipoprotein D and lipocalin family protein